MAASLVGMVIFLTVMDWWRFATHGRLGPWNLPRPTRWTFLSGIGTGLIVITTTMAYTIEGVSIVFAMLLMRGGLLILAPLVDFLSRRRVRWFSWAGLVLSLVALLVAFSEPPRPGSSRFTLNLFLLADVAVYLASYFLRLRFMSRLAKCDDPDVTKRYFVEEQMVATPVILLVLALLAASGGVPDAVPGAWGHFTDSLRQGFTTFWLRDPVIVGTAILIGVCSQFTGIFGGLILLDKSENAFAVPVNRCSSVLAGVLASLLLWLVWRQADPPQPPPDPYEMAGAAVVILAIVFLTVPPQWERRRALGAR
ncbi:MAG TPA: hypothetical protein PLQ97_10195 [Myxococcota bacterium]|nr:hypothetical protein [Myxococcota bacterium]HQK51320.1 hypothetical protein [Myxococcota bacterium]